MTPSALVRSSATEIAAAIAARRVAPRDLIEAFLERIAAVDPRIGAFTNVLGERARARADALALQLERGVPPGPLAGAPFAVKNLFDIEGLATRAGSKINRERAPARCDAALVRRLEAAGAILVGAVNMGEYAYDFTGENVHDGPSRNPHDRARMSGGSSGGSGAALAAGLASLTLGSDTNGSIRVPSAFCGVFGLKPTFGRLSRAGSFPFVASLDHLGPMARCAADLAVAYDVLQGPDPDDPWQIARPFEGARDSLDRGAEGLRVAVAGGYFRRGAEPAVLKAFDAAAAALGATEEIEFPEAERARAAAYILTAAEGAALHLDRLRARAADFDPAVRDRLIAGAMIPYAAVDRARRFRLWLRDRVRKLFDSVDVVLAPCAPCRAPAIGQQTFVLDGLEIAARPNIGVYTQPISFVGLPVAAVPVWPDAGLPTAVQVIAAPWREDHALRIARELERRGIASAPIAEP